LVVTNEVVFGTTKGYAETADELAKAIETMEGKNGSKWVLADIGSDTKFETKGVLYYTLNEFTMRQSSQYKYRFVS
jgi:Na+-translocating ferredoxin:NAD+ oxidoreductase RnfE subunit